MFSSEVSFFPLPFDGWLTLNGRVCMLIKSHNPHLSDTPEIGVWCDKNNVTWLRVQLSKPLSNFQPLAAVRLTAPEVTLKTS